MSNNIKLGIIYCCYGNPEYIDDCLKPWLEAKKQHDILIAAVHGQFKEYHDLGVPDNDLESIRQLSILHRDGNKIDHLYIQNHYTGFSYWQTEAEIRDKGLQWLLGQNCDYIILLDGDEKFSVEEINNIIKYIQKDEFNVVYKIEFKNLTFNKETYTKGFAPFRIWKVNVNDWKLHQVIYDNDMSFINAKTGAIKVDKEFSLKTIPVNLCNPLHYSWCDLEKSKLKIKYAEKRWNPPNGNGCSFSISKDGNSICLNEEYYKRIGQSPPELFKLNDN